MKWIKVNDELPDKTDNYLVCFQVEGHENINYFKVVGFLHTAYETPFMRWSDDHLASQITHWSEILEPAKEVVNER